MKMLFKQRFFSWFDSYDIYDENENTLFVVKGELAWGHMLRIYDPVGNEIGCVKQKLLTFLPKFEIYANNQYYGCINREFTLFHPRYSVECNGWSIEGDFMQWDYNIISADGSLVGTVGKELFNWTDTYSIEVANERDALMALMVVLAIDADKCSNSRN